MQKIRKILVPTDFSNCSDKAVSHALDLAQALGAQVTLLHACPEPYLGPLPETALGLETAYQSWGKLLDARRSAARETLTTMVDNEAERGIEVNFSLHDGLPAEATLEMAAEQGFDLIVMGTHGYTGLKHVFLGSVAERVVRLSSVPVLTVRQSE